MATKDFYPSIRPTLDLNFAGSRTVDPRITFTRASTATYFDEFGVMRTAPANTPRIDFDPVTGECKGLLVEEQRTNLLKYSEQFDNAEWVKMRNSVAPNAVAAPDGTLSGDKLVEDISTGWKYTNGALVSLTMQTYTFSVYAKAAERSVLQLIQDGAYFPGSYANFDLATGTVSASGGVDSVSIIHVGNGWYRCSITDTSVQAGTMAGFYVSVQNSTTAARCGSYAGDGTSGIYIWGAQLEAGAFPTSYIKTEASQVTRAADSAVMTGGNFSGWYRQDEGSFFIDYQLGLKLSASRAMSVSDGASDNMHEAVSGSGAVGTTGIGGYFLTTANGKTQAQLSEVAVVNTPFARYVNAYAHKVDSFQMAMNGVVSTEDTNGIVPVVDRMFIGANFSGIGQLLCGHIRRIAYYPQRLSNTQLQAITA